MSSDNASSVVTYTSVSSNTNGPSSWGISLVNTGELPEMDPYEKVSQQGQAHPLSPTYVPDPMELDEHVPVYVPEPEHLEYHAPSDDDIQVEDQPYAEDASLTAESLGYLTDSDSIKDNTNADSIDYPDEPKDGEDDDDEDPGEDPSKEHEPEDDDDDDDTYDEDEEPTEDEEEEEEHPAPSNSSVVPVVDPVPSARDTEAFETDKARKTVRLELPMSASIEARIAEHVALPILPTSPTYDQTLLGHREAMIPKSYAAVAARAPRRQYDFVDTVEARQGLIRSPGHDARTIARAADRAKDVGYVRALQAFEHRMMTSIEEVHAARTDHRDIRLKIDVVRGQRTAYETKLHERVEDDAAKQIMRIHVLEARAQIDTVEDTENSC
ncbi:hypothetical protein Tco_1469346, partial [Tanacetum coccineum]